MNLGTVLSLSAALLLLALALVFLTISRAPGWGRARLFTLMALTASAYAAVNVTFSVEAISLDTIRVVGVANYLFAAVHCSAWVVYAFSSTERPLRDLSPRLRWLVGATVLLGVIALIPGVATTDEVVTVRVPSFNVNYRQFETTVYADAVGLWCLLVLLLPFTQFVREMLRGERDAALRVGGFAVFFACGAIEVLVANGVIEFLYMADVGFLAIVLTLLAESVRRAMHDAEELQRLGTELSRQVDSRTRERDEARDALIHAERLAALGQLAARVGHEINNPLTYVRANVEYVRDALAQGKVPEETDELLAEVLQGTDRIHRVVADLRSYALPGSLQRERVDVTDVLRSALKVASHQLRHTAQVSVDLQDMKPVTADSVRLSQVFVNLLVNAGQAVQDAKRSDPRIAIRGHMDGEQQVVVEIEDNGVGISPEGLRRLSEPYYSTRLERGGTGLGLFVSRGILAGLGGSLEFESMLGSGTTARVILPSQRAEELDPSPDVTSCRRTARVQSEPRRVLVVDDEPAVARSIARVLSKSQVSIAQDGRSALAHLAKGEFDVVLCDVMMPGFSGVDVFDAVARRHPEVLPRLIFLTGGATLPEVAEFLHREGVRYLMKPFDRAQFEALFDELSRPG